MVKDSGADRALVASPSSLQAVSTKGFDHGEGICEDCGRNYRVWSADSPLWNAVMRGGSINGEEATAMICADCFMGRCEDAGIGDLFMVAANRVNVPLETVTPSGRVWDADRRLWADA